MAAVASVLLLAATSAARGEIELPAESAEAPIRIAARGAQAFREGSSEVLLLEGQCLIEQGSTRATGETAVLWLEVGRYGEHTGKITAYLEGNVVVLRQRGEERNRPSQSDRLTAPHWLGTFDSSVPLELHLPQVAAAPQVRPAVYQNAVARRDPQVNQAIQRTQFTETVPPPAGAIPAQPGTRRLQVFPRSSVAPTIDYFPNAANNEWVALITGGVNLIVDNVSVEGFGDLGPLDIVTDRLVVWTGGLQEPDLSAGSQTVQSEETPLEIYMEGNIVFRQGERKIEAQRMYYDVRRRVGIILEADVLTPVPEYQGLLRLRARVVRQLGENRFMAEDGFLTSSRMGRPGYRLEAGEIYYEDQERPVIDPLTGAPVVDPVTGEPVVDHERLATSYNNFLYLWEAPVFYWPTLATDLESGEFYIKRVRFGNDNIFGTQIETDFNLYQILGIRQRPEGTEWEASLDYLSERGFGFGSTFRYNRGDFLGLEGPVSGLIDAWAIDDRGLDTLGGDRIAVPLEEDFRYRILGQHRQILADGYQLSAELGLVSDRNFLEQYYEREWDEQKDQITGFELKRILDNQSYSISADVRLNDFFTQTEWLPRLDHYWLGQPLLGDRFTWFEHSTASYARLRVAEPPSNPVDAAKFGLLPWETEAEGERFITRQEIDYPFDVGPFKFVPYALGELGHWGEDRFGDDLQRAYGQVGLRASIPFWSVNPEIEDWLFNVHGIAHKIVFDADLMFADATRDLDELPLYEPLDDDNIEQFRRRLAFNTFGVPPTAIPPQFDARQYALRSGLGSWVTSPSMEVADDMAALRLGARQRWQTKRGPIDRRRIVDFVVLDTNAVFFPNDDRDNFGESLGLVSYDFRWHVGDRTTIVSDAMVDFFDEGQQLFSLGAFLNRPTRGGLFIGYQMLGGPIDSEVLFASYSYRMSPKWVSAISASMDISGDGNIGQMISLTRIGESFLTTFGFNVDASKNNVGLTLAIEPRFLPRTRTGLAGGVPIPPAGLYGVE
jgi:hypothetical protein